MGGPRDGEVLGDNALLEIFFQPVSSLRFISAGELLLGLDTVGILPQVFFQNSSECSPRNSERLTPLPGASFWGFFNVTPDSSNKWLISGPLSVRMTSTLIKLIELCHPGLYSLLIRGSVIVENVQEFALNFDEALSFQEAFNTPRALLYMLLLGSWAQNCVICHIIQ